MSKKKKIEKIGTIDKMTIFNAEKERFIPSFRSEGYITEKDRPRKKVNKRNINDFL